MIQEQEKTDAIGHFLRRALCGIAVLIAPTLDAQATSKGQDMNLAYERAVRAVAEPSGRWFIARLMWHAGLPNVSNDSAPKEQQ